MISQPTSNSLIKIETDIQGAIRHALRLWANAVTSASSEQREHLVRYKQQVVASFFAFGGHEQSPADVSAHDVEEWRDDLVRQGLKPATVYARVCFLSSFFAWALRDPLLKTFIKTNPARLALPKAPKAYQTESVKAWTDEELQGIVDVVKAKADTGDAVGKRDYALLLFFLVTGMRRQEVIGLRGTGLKLDGEGVITVTGKVKGGDYVGREVRDPLLQTALLDYLASCGRLEALKTDAPIWTRHDRAGRAGAPLTSHAFAKNLKRYAEAAGVSGAHIHQTRHSYARIVAEETGSITDVQDALGHRNAATTRIYVQRITVKRDKHSQSIVNRLRRKI